MPANTSKLRVVLSTLVAVVIGLAIFVVIRLVQAADSVRVDGSVQMPPPVEEPRPLTNTVAAAPIARTRPIDAGVSNAGIRRLAAESKSPTSNEPSNPVITRLREMPPDREAESLGASLHPFADNLSFANNAVRLEQYRTCMHSWVPPPGVQTYEANLIMGLEGVDGGLAIRDSELDNANVADADLEQCLLDINKDLVVPVPNAVPGKLYRITWPLSLSHP